jgi:ComF family protein
MTTCSRSRVAGLLRSPLAAQCRLCASPAPHVLCARCEAAVFAEVPRCPRCAQPSPQSRLCGRCVREPPAFDRSVALADYDALSRPLVEALKFHDTPGLAAPLARHMADAIARSGAPLPQWLLPVPLSPARLRQRGYNQAWELAKALARALGVPARCDVLLRVRDAAPQASLAFAERRRNVRDAFVCPQRLDAAQVAVIDDVMTTGATLDEAARTLKRAGAAAVSCYVLCRTPLG